MDSRIGLHDGVNVDGTAIEGKATAITVMTPVRPGGTPLLRLVFWAGAHVRSLNAKLVELSFIHFARWVLVTAVPYNGPPQRRENLHHDYLFFESNFNGTWDEYIDAFSEVVPERMSAIWGSSYGFPGGQPVGPFKDYIRRNDLDVSHYYSAYPDATTTEVLSALAVAEQFRTFQDRTAGFDPQRFATAWADFVAAVQHQL